ncbi:uncharacterized protein LOC123411655 isoform X2 [Hordeum vulgare subsp. vulgare]|nr:uncharacterized protein LOC123411655 isoform X2 [Hordeum vulgare subsp. vulgare]
MDKLAGRQAGIHDRRLYLCYKGLEEWSSQIEADSLPRLLATAINPISVTRTRAFSRIVKDRFQIFFHSCHDWSYNG